MTTPAPWQPGDPDRRRAPRDDDHRRSMARGEGHRHVDESVTLPSSPPPLLIDAPITRRPTRLTTRVTLRVTVAGLVVGVMLAAAAAWSVNSRVTRLEHDRVERRAEIRVELNEMRAELDRQRGQSREQLCALLVTLRGTDQLAARAFETYCTTPTPRPASTPG